MTIHQIINDVTAGGGAEKIVRTLHQEYLKRGIDSRVLSLSGDVTDIPACQSLNLSKIRDIFVIFSISRYLKEHCSKSDVVHVHLFPSSLFVSLAKCLSGWDGKLVFTEHSTHNRRRGTLLGKLIDLVLYSPYSRIACISEGTKETLGRWMPKFLDRLSIVGNGVPLSFTSFSARDNNSTPVILSMGRLQHPKNYPLALRAVALIKEVDFEYWIAGTGEDEGLLRAMAEELEIKDKVKFLGFVHDIPCLLQQADIFFMPSKWEGFGLAAVEAMNAGLPAVVSDVDGLREVVTKESAFLVPKDRPDLFADALRNLISCPELRSKMGERGFERAKLFSAKKMADKYLEFYKMARSS